MFPDVVQKTIRFNLSLFLVPATSAVFVYKVYLGGKRLLAGIKILPLANCRNKASIEDMAPLRLSNVRKTALNALFGVKNRIVRSIGLSQSEFAHMLGVLPIRGWGLISMSIRSSVRAKNTGSRDYYGVTLTSLEPGDSLEVSMAVT